jgi:hypothetical protein
MTIKLGYPVSINESSFRFAGIHCINNMFLVVLCISLNKGCHLLQHHMMRSGSGLIMVLARINTCSSNNFFH